MSGVRCCLVSVAAVASLLGGCASVQPLADQTGEPAALPADLQRRFCYAALPLAAELELRDENGDWRRLNGSIEVDAADPASGITFEFYQPLSVDRPPVVLVLPILNGQKDIVRPFARYFAKHGYAAFIVDTSQRKTLADDLIDPQRAIDASVVRHRRMLDWIAQRDDVDARRVAVFGASLGGFNALYLAAVDPRVAAVAPALAGGDLPYVFVNSTENRVEDAVAEARRRLDLDVAGFEAHLRARIATDPLTFAPHLRAERVLMVMARYDTAVPYARQQALRDAIGGPETITLPSGHVSSAFYLFYLRKRVVRFFDRILAGPAGSVSTAPTGTDFCDAAETTAPAGR